MAFSIAANTRLAGSPQGNYLDDLTNPGVGQWPKTLAIKNITKITVFAGTIIDSLRVTYQVEAPTLPITVQHGGPGGAEALTFDIGIDEKLIAVYGAQLLHPSPFGDKNIVQLSFVVANSALKTPTTKVYTATAKSPEPSSKFDFSWSLVAAASYTVKPPGAPIAYLQAVGFSKVLDQ